MFKKCKNPKIHPKRSTFTNKLQKCTPKNRVHWLKNSPLKMDLERSDPSDKIFWRRSWSECRNDNPIHKIAIFYCFEVENFGKNGHFWVDPSLAVKFKILTTRFEGWLFLKKNALSLKLLHFLFDSFFWGGGGLRAFNFNLVFFVFRGPFYIF